jgi:hypothetical protein
MGAYGGRVYSWTHNETSTEISQKPLAGTFDPTNGEIDLMKDAAHKAGTFERWDRSTASEQDVKGLLWLSRVKFIGG